MDNNLRVERAKADITQQELADAVGVSRQTIYAIEKSKYDPSLELAFKLARYFDCSIEDLFEPDLD
ncbi:helix-turn-helix transcriptional regulator [Halostella sp. PRR32]|uniref:helix-turn-helix transcriptional regulator n=1 Tax=Halostella sp. PRR32 TaxID=3098147 RepID=UPI002B1E0D8B|nr:helix-turn-helix transcriptional regulator [Halostella sp. PRR32]